MDHTTIPCLGLRDSLRFGTDLDTFLAAGRALGPVWAFDVVLGPLRRRRMTVYSDPAVCRTLLALPSVSFFEPAPFIDWLGPASPIVSEGQRHADLRGIAGELVEHLDPAALLRAVDRDLRKYPWRPGSDIGELLRASVLWWLIPALDVTPKYKRNEPIYLRVERWAKTVRAADRWLRYADTPATVIPPLRAVSPRWWRLGAAARRLDEMLGCHPGSIRADVVRTLILGAADAPVLLALEALAWWEHNADVEHHRTSESIVDEVLADRAPIPLIVRETAEDIQLYSTSETGPVEISYVELSAGGAFAVDAARAGLPFGAGPHACLAGQVGRALAIRALDTAREIDLHLKPGKRGRVRCGHGYRRITT